MKDCVPTSLKYDVKELKSYSGFNIVKPKVFTPQNRAELLSVIAYLNKMNRKFSITGSTLSFDEHALNEHYVISTKKICHINLNLEGNLITVGTGTTWQSVVDALIPYGYAPYIAPTAGFITVGGSISCDTYCRFTPGYGRESKWVKSISIITTEGKLIKCSKESNSRLFYSIMGGLGIIAIIYEIEFEVQYIGPKPAVYTIAYFENDYKNISFIKKDSLLPFQKKEHPGAGLVIYDYKGEYRTLFVKHYWGSTEKRKSGIAHQRKGFLRILGGVLVRVFPKLASSMWNMSKKHIDKQTNRQALYIDSPGDMLFCMEADCTSKSIAQKLGINTKILQQSFIIPCKDKEESSKNITKFVSYCLAKMEKAKIKPAMIDVGFIPKDNCNAFSSSNSGYILSIAVEGKAIISYETLFQLFNDFSEVCYEKYDGKIHLTKNILCSKELLMKMYASEINNIKLLKDIYDPKSLLETNFFSQYLKAEQKKAYRIKKRTTTKQYIWQGREYESSKISPSL